jgi:hypothetical protein
MPFDHTKLPFSVKAPAGIVGAIVTGLVSTYAGIYQPYALMVAAALAVWVVIGSIWHFTNERRLERGKPKLIFDPGYIVAAGLILAGIGVALQTMSAKTYRRDDDLEKRVNGLTSSFEKYVSPRKLTAEQAAKIEEFLLRRPKQKLQVIFENNNIEANQYAVSIYEAFSRGGWEAIDLRSAQPTETIPEGIYINSIYPRTTTHNMVANDDAKRALETADVHVSGSGASRNGDSDDVIVMIRVGHKPRT